MPFGKSALVLPVPCQVRLQPPVWFWSESALLPTTSTFEDCGSGSSFFSFLSSTCDSRTARRASAGSCSAEPSVACSRADGLGWSIRPVRSFTRRIRVTASSIRAIGISPEPTWASVLAMNAFQSCGTITTSMPALIACGQLALVQPATWPMPFQSETTRPSKPILPLRISVSAFFDCRAACPRRSRAPRWSTS